MPKESNSFSEYMNQIFKEKGFAQERVFLFADIPEKYGCKLISGEKWTKRRDVIIRICYAAKMSLAETQQALTRYGMPELDAEARRDALIMSMFHNRPGGIIEANLFLKKNRMEPLRSCGLQE